MKYDFACALARKMVLEGADFQKMRWRHHGLGMLQGELNEEWRVHIWDPSLVTIPDGPRRVHDHRFDIDSAVLFGQVIDVRFQVIRDVSTSPDAERTTCWAIKHAKIQTGGQTDAEFLYVCRAIPYGSMVFNAGQSYVIPRRVFHTTKVKSLAVTLVRRSNFDTGDARVLGDGNSAIVGIHRPAEVGELHGRTFKENEYAELVERAWNALKEAA